MKKIIVLTVAALFAIVLSSCCACRLGSPKIANLEADNWKLIEFQDQAVPNEKAVTLAFDAEKKMIYGTAPCNNFFASYSLFDNAERNIRIENGGATRKFCPDTEIEDAFTRQLTNITRLKIEGERLLMLDAEGYMVALLIAVPKTATQK